MLTVGLVTVIQHGEGALNGSTVVQGTGRGTVLWRLLVLCDSGATALHCGNGISKRVCSESFAEQGQPWWATARQGKASKDGSWRQAVTATEEGASCWRWEIENKKKNKDRVGFWLMAKGSSVTHASGAAPRGGSGSKCSRGGERKATSDWSEP